MIRQVLGRVNKALAFAAGGSMLVIMLLTVNEVTRRYLFNAPTRWSLEMTQYLLLFCIYLGMAYSVQTGAHVTVHLAYQHLSQRIQKTLDAITSILVLVFWIILFRVTLDLAIDYLARNVRSETVLATPLIYPMLLVCVGSFVTCLQAILGIYDRFVQLRGES